MPDPTITDDGQTADDAALEVEEGAGAPAEAENAEGKLIGGKFKSDAEVLKAYQETEAKGTRMAQELAELRKKADTADTQKGLVDAFKEAMADKGNELDDAALRKSWIERLEGDQGAEAQIDLMLALQAEQDAKNKKVEALLDSKTAALEKKLAESEARSDPVYAANREKIDALAEKRGISRTDALEIYKDLVVPSAAKPLVADGKEAGGGLAAVGGRVDRKVDPRAGWTDQERKWEQEWDAAAARAEGASK